MPSAVTQMKGGRVFQSSGNNHVEHLGKKIQIRDKVVMSVHDYLVIYDIYVALLPTKKIGSKTSLSNRGFVGWPQFQIINHFNSSN